MTDDAARRYQAFLRQPAFSMLGFLVAWYLFNPIFEPVNLLALYPGGRGRRRGARRPFHGRY